MTKKESINNKEYSVIMIMVIFLTLISLVAVTRMVIIYITSTNTYADISVISSLQYDETKDMKSIIQRVKKTMEEHFGFNIYYGSVLQDVATSIDANVIYDEQEILSMLQEINMEFSRYPDGLIDEIQSRGYKVSVYLVDSFNNGNIALANRTSNGYFNIFLSNDRDFAKAMHHEFYHILEYYMKLEFDINEAFASWSDFNPEDFDYTNSVKTITTKYVYGLDSQNELSFVTLYSKYSDAEDRAEIFSSMMTSNEKYILNDKASNIILKMDSVTDVLNNLFVCVGENEYWERYRE